MPARNRGGHRRVRSAPGLVDVGQRRDHGLNDVVGRDAELPDIEHVAFGRGLEPFAPLEDVVDQVVDEITNRELSRVMLWGHSSGTAFALATARQLRTRGIEVQRVFLAAQLLGDAAARRAHIDEINHLSDSQIAAALSAAA